MRKQKRTQRPQHKATIPPTGYDMVAGGGAYSLLGHTKHYPAECVRLIGQIAIEWALVDQMMRVYYATLVLTPRRFSDPAEIITMETFEGTHSLKTKGDLLLNAANKRLPKGDILNGFGRVIHEVMDAGKLRGEIVHGIWSLSPKRTDALVYQRATWEPHKLHDVAYLRSVVDEIVRAGSEFAVYFSGRVLPILQIIEKSYVEAVAAEQNDANEN